MKFISEELSNITCSQLNKQKLEILMDADRTNSYLNFLTKFISKDDKILDLACGYGRLTIPLAKLGYNIEGLDLSPDLIKIDKSESKKSLLKTNFTLGNMKKTDYPDNTFDSN